MTRDEARSLIIDVTNAWVEDETSSVVWAGSHEGRWGIRMAQENRDFTTLWFDIGERTVRLEAYLLPQPHRARDEVYRQALIRNWSSWPVWIALDRLGDLHVVGRIPLTDLRVDTLDGAVGAVYELVDVSFRRMVEAGFGVASPRQQADT